MCATMARLTKPPRKHGNPDWGKGIVPVRRATATEFEIEMRRLGLTKQTCARSVELRCWCERNKNRVFIPEWLLAEWGLTVDPTGSAGV